MARVQFNCNSGANIHSCRSEWVDTVEELGMEEGEWEGCTEDEKFELVREWAEDRLEIYYEEE